MLVRGEDLPSHTILALTGGDSITTLTLSAWEGPRDPTGLFPVLFSLLPMEGQ